jgi:mercuric ion transport protein
MEANRRKRLLWTGLIGSSLVALCCFTPILVVLLGLVGLGALTGYLDVVLLPALALFLGLALYAGTRRQQDTGGACCASHASESRKP